MSDIRVDLAEVLNTHSIDNDLNTPDFLLANYIMECLGAYGRTKRANDAWHGKDKDGA